MKTVVRLVAVGVALAATGLPAAVYATDTDEYIMDTSSIGQSHNGVVNSSQLLELGGDNPGGLLLEGENALHTGHLDRALMVLQRSVELAPMDIDGRILYAQALEQKMMGEKIRNPSLFNFCVKQWFYVYKKAEFPDQSIQGRAHLITLTGVAPRKWDKEQQYLAKVTLPETGTDTIAMTDKKPVPHIETKVASHIVGDGTEK